MFKSVVPCSNARQTPYHQTWQHETGDIYHHILHFKIQQNDVLDSVMQQEQQRI